MCVYLIGCLLIKTISIVNISFFYLHQRTQVICIIQVMIIKLFGGDAMIKKDTIHKSFSSHWDLPGLVANFWYDYDFDFWHHQIREISV